MKRVQILEKVHYHTVISIIIRRLLKMRAALIVWYEAQGIKSPFIAEVVQYFHKWEMNFI